MNDIQYKDSIVVFLDLLGFSKKVEKENLIKEIHNVISYIKAWNTSNGENKFIEEKDFIYEDFLDDKVVDYKKIQKELQISFFSDSTVITLPYSSDELDIKLFLIIRALAYVISKIAMQNFFVRGGISIGKMFHEDNIYFGPAYLDAYKLESENASYPRVILSEVLKQKAKKMPYIKEAEDGLVHVDWIYFLKKQEKMKFLERMSNLPSLKYITEIINQNINNSKNIRVKAKYIWLRRQIENEKHIYSWIKCWKSRFFCMFIKKW